MPHFIFIQQISVLNILNMLYNLHFFSSKCRLFHNSTLFGFCITHILNTGCAKIWKKNRRQKVNTCFRIFLWQWDFIVIFSTVTPYSHIEVKQSSYSSGQALRVSGGWGSPISRKSVHEGGKFFNLTHWPSLPPWNVPGTDFYLRLNLPQGNNAAGRIMSTKNFQWHHWESKPRPFGL